VRKWLRRWLGINDIENRLIKMLVTFGQMTKEQAEEVISSATDMDYRRINNHGEEGQL